MTSHILIVDDEDDIRFLLQGILDDEGYQTSIAASSKEALKLFSENTFDAIILDVWLQEGSSDGLNTLGKVMEEKPETPVIMISGHSTIEIAVSAIKNGAYDFIEKPFKTDRLLVMLKRAIEFGKLQSENKILKRKTSSVSKITGKANLVVSLRQAAEKAAHSNSRILISGEDGTGKKTLARFIHANSTLKDEPTNVLICQGHDEEAMVAQIERAIKDSDGATLILDHVEKLPLSAQEKLLYFLQSGKLNNTSYAVRIISLTSSNLENAVKSKSFKSDLFYRLSVVPLRIPMLRERLEDIESIIDDLYKQVTKSEKSLVERLSPSALVQIKAYSWPGNIRQLKNFIEWLEISVLPKTEKVSANDLPQYLTEEEGEGYTDSDDFMQTALDLPLRDAREVFETLYIKSQITRFDGNISKTSDFIGMERSALHRKIRSLNINSSKDDDTEDLPDNVKRLRT